MKKKDRDQLKELLHLVNALLKAMDTSLQTLPDNLWKYAGYPQYVRKYNEFVQLAGRLLPNQPLPVGPHDLEDVPSMRSGVGLEHKQCFESVYTNVLLLRAFIETKLDLKADEITNLTDFFQANLRRAILHPPEREQDIQDVVELFAPVPIQWTPR